MKGDSMRIKSGRLLASISLLVAAFTAAPAQAQTTVVSFTVTCTGVGQLCTPPFTTPVTTTGLLQVAYTASAGHCSNISAHFLVDGVQLAVTPFLTPGQTSATYALSPVSAGTHTLGVQGEGQLGGCNVGSVANWGGSVQITVNAPVVVAAPVPGPGLIATALALLLGAFAFFRRRRG
jgi:hypothetical protein